MDMKESVMPDCWNDDMRMGALFSPFRKRDVNPVDWESKLLFWESLIEKWCIFSKRSKVSLQLLKKVFQRKGATALCLETVFAEMIRDGTLVLYSDFVKLLPQESWAAWVVELAVRRPVVWSFNKLKDVLLSSTVRDDVEYVHIPAVKLQAEELLSTLQAKDKNKLWEVEELCILTGHVPEAKEEVVLAVHWLHHQNKAALFIAPLGGSLLVKVAEASAKLVRVTELDLGKYTLQCNERTLTRHVEQLEEEQEALLNQAKEYMTRSMKQMAKSCLRRRKQLDRCVEKRISALENVRLLLGRLHDTESDAQVLDAYRTGVSALKTAFSKAGLTEDTAANTVLQVQETLDIQEEINAALSQPIGSSVEEELEKELADLLDNTESGPPGAPSPNSGTKPPQKEKGVLAVVEKKEDKPALILPEVPSHEPWSPTSRQLPA